MNVFLLINIYWWALPLVVSISLVYAATRHESWRRIWSHAARLCVMILCLMAAATGLLLFINTQV